MFTAEAFHAGQRNDGTTCAWCHTPNRTSSGWSADSAYFVHAIHAGDKREKPFTWHASAVGKSFADIGYPGILSKCETCHLPGTYDFSAARVGQCLAQSPVQDSGNRHLQRHRHRVGLQSTAISPYVTADNVARRGRLRLPASEL